MAETNRRAGPALKDQLFQRACDFNFFQAVRLLEWIAWEEQAAGGPRRASPGTAGAPSEELVRFRVPPASAFAASSVSALRPGDSGSGLPADMLVWFLGLIGPSGVLPEHYTAAAFARSGDSDDALREFFDLFQHRTVSLFYRAGNKYRLPLELERRLRQESLSADDAAAESDPFSFALRSLVGLGEAGLTGRMQAADETVVYYSGHYTHACPSALSLARMLEDYFGLPVAVEQFSGRWLTLPADQRTSLPSSGRPKGAYCALNREAIVGARVWDVQTKFRIRLGPMSYARFEGFLPGASAMQQLSDLVKLYVGPALEFEVQPILKKDEVPAARLKPRGGPQNMIGRTGWLASRPRTKDAEEAIFRVTALA